MRRDHYRLVCELEESESTVAELDASTKRSEAILKCLEPMVKFVDQPKSDWYKMRSAVDEIILVEDDGDSVIGPLSRHSALMRSINIGYLRFVYVDKPDADIARKRYREFLEEEKAAAKARALAEKSGASGEHANKPASGDQSVGETVQQMVSSRTITGSEGTAAAQLKLEPSTTSPKGVQSQATPKRGAQDAV